MHLPVATRPIRDDDLLRLVRLWPRLSPETRYRRFHAPVQTLPPAAVRRLVHVDHDTREAVVALVADEVVGVARYDRSPTDRGSAELAVVVEDDWQGLGLGRQLMREVVALAAVRGVRRLTADVQEDNVPALRLVARLLPTASVECEDGICAVDGSIGTPRPALVTG
ncbi:GNAT family N-acetyltransferase [Blastococcus sp. TF02A-26]|uniref:GNAT family N-acetyltransferase n=1 Tax=Blastococcus sp. TF02A-26 TaxID=2250577 RepID=UPI000DEAD304|nr:GNAT family N-acetyltransferase [Blastococcus sp. TF02A-26]RBY83365.1 GNAT family N-acetyltransferase [Blastococcus sp. TF02A-26]